MAVVSGSTTFSQAQVLQTFVATLEERRKDLVDSVLLSHPTLEKFKSGAKSGSGTGIRVPVRLSDLGVTGYTDSSGTYSKTVSPDLIKSVTYNWPAMITTPWTLDHREIKMNEGSATQIINLVQKYIEFAKSDHGNFLSAALWDVAGFTTDTEKVIPIPVLVDDTAVLGGLNPATHTKWKSVVRTFDGTVAGSSLLTEMDELSDDIFVECREKPSTVIVGRNAWRRINKELKDLNQNTQPRTETQETRFTEITNEGRVIRLDPDAPADTLIFLNDAYLVNEYLSDEFMKVYNPTGNGTNDGNLNTTVLLATTWQVGLTRRNAHGKIVGNFGA